MSNEAPTGSLEDEFSEFTKDQYNWLRTRSLEEIPNWMEDGVAGNFGFALDQLVGDLLEHKLSSYQMLTRWDKVRGNDWFTQTRKQLTEIDLDEEDNK